MIVSEQRDEQVISEATPTPTPEPLTSAEEGGESPATSPSPKPSTNYSLPTTHSITILTTGLFDDTGAQILRVRATPDSGSAQVGTVVTGATLTYSIAESGWYQITLGDGVVGWISEQYAEVN